jgi:Signal transduction histidine kinase
MVWLGADDKGPAVVVGTGVGLFLVAVSHHAVELMTVESPVGPLAALALDGVPALGLAYAGRRLADRSLDSDHAWSVARWCLGGGAVFTLAIGLSMGIRILERRVLTEPLFTLLLAAEAGTLAGFVAGYYRERALVDKRRAQESAEALAAVNDVIRHDLRNDLQVIELSTDLLAAESGSDRAESAHRRATQACQRLDDTEAIAKAMDGTTTLGIVDLAAATAEVVEQVETTHGVEVEVDLPESALVAANDGVRSVVDNLLENAVEHSDRDDPQVAVSVEVTGGTVRLTVRDRGPGLGEDEQASSRGPGSGG